MSYAYLVTGSEDGPIAIYSNYGAAVRAAARYVCCNGAPVHEHNHKAYFNGEDWRGALSAMKDGAGFVSIDRCPPQGGGWDGVNATVEKFPLER